MSSNMTPTPANPAATTGIFSPATPPGDASPITVYFPVNTHVSTVDVQLFGQDISTPDRIIFLDTAVSADKLGKFLQYCQDPANRDNVLVSTMADQKSALETELDAAVNGNMTLDSNYASWWKDGSQQVANASNYVNFKSVSEFLLGQICYDVLGHPLAQAGLANDTEILAALESGAVAENVLGDMEVKSANGLLNPSDSLRVVYQQMFSKSPARFDHADNNEGIVSANNTLPLQLPFAAGDHIRFELTLNAYKAYNYTASDKGTYDVGSNGSNADNFSGTNFTYSNNTNIDYTGYGANTYTVDVVLSE